MVGRGDPVGRVDRDELRSTSPPALCASTACSVAGNAETGPFPPVRSASWASVAVEPDRALQHQLVGDLGLADRAVPVGVGDREQRVQRGGGPGRVAHADHEPAPGRGARTPARSGPSVIAPSTARQDSRCLGQPSAAARSRGTAMTTGVAGQRRAGPRQRGGRLRPARGQPGPDARLGRPGVRPAAGGRGAEGGRDRRRLGPDHGDRRRRRRRPSARSATTRRPAGAAPGRGPGPRRRSPSPAGRCSRCARPAGPGRTRRRPARRRRRAGSRRCRARPGRARPARRTTRRDSYQGTSAAASSRWRPDLTNADSSLTLGGLRPPSTPKTSPSGGSAPRAPPDDHTLGGLRPPRTKTTLGGCAPERPR